MSRFLRNYRKFLREEYGLTGADLILLNRTLGSNYKSDGDLVLREMANIGVTRAQARLEELQKSRVSGVQTLESDKGKHIARSVLSEFIKAERHEGD